MEEAAEGSREEREIKAATVPVGWTRGGDAGRGGGDGGNIGGKGIGEAEMTRIEKSPEMHGVREEAERVGM